MDGVAIAQATDIVVNALTQRRLLIMTKQTNTIVSKADAEIIGFAALRVWEIIGHDILSLAAEYDNKDSIPRSEVIEVVVDAGRLEDELKRKHPECAIMVREMDYKAIVKLLRPFFPYSRYGM